MLIRLLAGLSACQFRRSFVCSLACFSLLVIVFCKCSTSLPGGNQVDGLPPAASLQEKSGEENYFPKNL